MDISASTAPRTDQQNFDNYLAGPKTLTISEVKAGTVEQPIELHLVEFPGQPYKPSKSMRRVLISCWGAEASVYSGRKITLYGDPAVRFGSAVVGGIKISHLSHIDKAVKVNLTVTRGKRELFTVNPLTVAPAANAAMPIEPTVVSEWVERITACGTIDDLHLAWREASNAKVAAHPSILAAKDKRKSEL